MKRFAIACFLSVPIVCAIDAGWSSHAASPPETSPGSAAATIKELQQERIKLLGIAAKILTAQYQVGTVDYAEAKSAERELLEARLDAAETPQQRIAVLEELQKSAEDLEKIVEARFNNGRCSEADPDRGRAWVLQVRIKLLRERQAVGTEKK